MIKEVYIVVDNYTEGEPTIYGTYSTRSEAERAFKELESEDNDYGENMNEDGTLEIEVLDIQQ